MMLITALIILLGVIALALWSAADDVKNMDKYLSFESEAAVQSQIDSQINPTVVTPALPWSN